VSTESYSGRHRAGRPRGLRIPRTLSADFVLPTAAAAALVVSATGAAVADTSPLGLQMLKGGPGPAALKHLSAFDAAQAKARLDEIEQHREMATAGILDRIAEQERAARAAQRVALERSKAAAAAKEAAQAKLHRWILPLTGDIEVTSEYGWRWGRLHAGVDFAAPIGTPLHAMSQGQVIFAGWQSGYGYKVEIRYWDGTVSYFAHLSRVSAVVGELVVPGEVVGYSGNTGHSTGPHLHLEIHPDGGVAVDPIPWLAAHGLTV
jgi:murein DD-endopeptidase MepM/ murein hydrolase activator NlpD